MELARLLILPDAPIREAVARIDLGHVGAVVVVDAGRRLLGVVTDGDVRRALLARVDFGLPVQLLLDRRPRDLYPEPVAVTEASTRAERVALMRARRVRHLPVLAEDGRVVAFECLDDVADASLDVQGVVMAGGFGQRLRPLTEQVPKPLLPVGAKPVLEHLVSHLAAAGVRDLTITTHYRGDQIRQHFGDGSRLGVAIQYVDEQAPLGTAGVLRLLCPAGRPMFVINGDILTRLDVGSMLRFHREHHADLTVAIRSLETQVPYGVIEVHGSQVIGVLEKPTAHYFVNAGMYLIEPAAFAFLPGGADRFDMPDFIAALVAAGRPVVGFPIREYWLDIGHPDQYAQAQADMAEGRY